ncbi:PLP-dependent aminotransferase family protein [uncultured Chitinophaga sp.]|jgi:Transcriptional regulators containing a DNA-binding HTH domain and an aminotransferase domain (MocR family) and their eukaryotic orthologs|uniref:aminotransferase class I/II-fold pyridoxal phosphate-dependent enzyme n=1 Tax=uncultured Chitinophaga sp. TaxID=339340 RepID=UPI0026227D52|nr:PLP-dependent aminotransferase family protein [uncultured Chitinophaga sp.]
MLNLRFNYPSVRSEADIFEQYIRGLPAHEKYGMLSPASFWPEKPFVQLLGQWLQLPADTLRYQSEVISTCSGNSALHCILTWFRNTEQTAAVEEFTYTSFKASAAELGYDIHTIACDEQGMVPEALEEYLRSHNTRLVYLQPTIHNPTCSVMSLQRRRDIATVVRKFRDVYIIEDDAYRFLHPLPPPTFLQLMPDKTLYVCSFSKNFNPFVRAAYLVYPQGLLKGVDNVIRYTTSGSSALFRNFSAYLMKDDLLQGVIAEKRAIAVQLHEKVTQIFQGLDYRTFPGSYHTWLKLPDSLEASVFISEMRTWNIDLMSSEDFSTTNRQDYVRIALGAVWDAPELLPALKTVANALRKYNEH